LDDDQVKKMNIGPEKKLGNPRSTMMTSMESDRPEGVIYGGGPNPRLTLAGEQSLGDVDMAGHSNLRVSVQRFSE
jgi:hypothetical protein